MAELAPVHQQVLRAPPMQGDEPGTVLRDVETLLAFLGDNTPTVSAKHHRCSAVCSVRNNGRLPISMPCTSCYGQPDWRVSRGLGTNHVWRWTKTDSPPGDTATQPSGL